MEDVFMDHLITLQQVEAPNPLAWTGAAVTNCRRSIGSDPQAARDPGGYWLISEGALGAAVARLGPAISRRTPQPHDPRSANSGTTVVPHAHFRASRRSAPE